MGGNGKPGAPSGAMRLEAHWRLVSWSVLDKSLPALFGFAFVLLVVRALPAEEFGLQTLASAMLLTLSQLLRALLLLPMIKYVAEGRAPARVAATGACLHVAASGLAALLLGAGREAWAGLFAKPDLAAVLVPSAVLLAAGSGREAAVSSLEGLRRLRTVFWVDLAYYAAAVAALVVWRASAAPRSAVAVQWVQAGAAAFGTLVALLAARRLVLGARPARAEAARIAGFGAYSFGAGLGATLSQQADTLVVGRLLDARGVAAYGTAKLLFRGFNLLAQSVAQVLMPAVSRLQAEGRAADLRVLFEKSVCFLTLAVVPACLLLMAVSGPLLDLLFAGRYTESVPVFQVLVASALALPLASVGSPFLTGLGRVRALLWITWAGVVVGLALTIAWAPRHGPVGAAAAALAAAVFGMLARALVLRRVLGFRVAGIVARTRDVTAFVRRRLSLDRSQPGR